MTFEPCDHHIQAEKLARITPETWREEMAMTPLRLGALESAMKWLNELVIIPCDDGYVQIRTSFGGRDFVLGFDEEGPLAGYGEDEASWFDAEP